MHVCVNGGSTCTCIYTCTCTSSYGDTFTNVHYCVVVHVIITESVLIILEVYSNILKVYSNIL